MVNELKDKGKQDVQSRPKWVLPPGLLKQFEKFTELYERVFKQPRSRKVLLIHGDPGVGKTLFTDIFEKLYRRDRPRIKDNEVKRVNVSAITESLFLSELFGYKKGAFTDAKKDRKGLVDSAKLLILEEIGELSKSTQAKLLTFVEEGIYYKVGSNKQERAQGVQIIATTNVDLSEQNIRSDFLGRCYTFHVPALHNRRQDILHILAHDYLDLTKRLFPWQVLAVMAYHWPGNMREIEKFGMMGGETSYCDEDFYDPLLFIELRSILDQMGIDKSVVSSVLRHGSLSFSGPFSMDKSNFDSRPALSHIKRPQLQYSDVFPEMGIMKESEDLQQVMYGFMNLSNLLYVKFWANVNLIDTNKVFENPKYLLVRNGTFFSPIRAPLLVRDAGAHADKVWSDFLERSKAYLQQRIYGTREKSEQDLFLLSEENLLKAYYRNLLRRTGGNRAKAARHAGMKDRTFRSRLKKYNIK